MQEGVGELLSCTCCKSLEELFSSFIMAYSFGRSFAGFCPSILCKTGEMLFAPARRKVMTMCIEEGIAQMRFGFTSNRLHFRVLPCLSGMGGNFWGGSCGGGGAEGFLDGDLASSAAFGGEGNFGGSGGGGGGGGCGGVGGSAVCFLTLPAG